MIQIPEKLFYYLCLYHLTDDGADLVDMEYVRRELQKKYDAMEKRREYAQKAGFLKDKNTAP